MLLSKTPIIETYHSIPILYEDNHVIVVFKPVGLLSQEDYSGDVDILNELKSYLVEKYQKPGNAYLGLVHRLDRMVSGVMVFAKTSKAASRISAQIRERTFKKLYLAVVEGQTESSDILEHSIEKDSSTNRVRVYSGQKKGKNARLSYERLAVHAQFSLLKVELHTGRPHQIRAQLAHIGHPIVGDAKYGSALKSASMGLMSYSLAFKHPTKKETLNFAAIDSSHPTFKEFSKTLSLLLPNKNDQE